MTTEPFHIVTPLIHSRELSALLGREVLLKLDNLQPAGSFKIRGIGRTVQLAVKDGVRHLVGCSGGNAGLAMAYAAQKTKAKLTLFIPKSTKPMMFDKIKSYGVDLRIVGKDLEEAKNEAEKFLKEHEDAFFVHPFNQPTTWKGHSSLVAEVKKQLPDVSQWKGKRKPALFITAVGGGGLAIGLLKGMKKAGWSKVPLVGVETKGSACFSESLRQGRHVKLDKIATIATSLGCRECDPKLLELAAKRPVFSKVVSDARALKACLKFSDDHRMLVEPACGTALAALYYHNKVGLQDILNGGKKKAKKKRLGPVIVVVCGGSMASIELYQEWKEQLGIRK